MRFFVGFRPKTGVSVFACAKKVLTYMIAKSKNIRKYYQYYLIGLLCLACEDNHTIYQNTHTLSHKIWPATAIELFTFYIADPTQAYDIALLITNNPTYPYQNLFVSYELKGEKEHLLQRGLQEGMLFEPKTGKPLGKGWNKKKSHQFVICSFFWNFI